MSTPTIHDVKKFVKRFHLDLDDLVATGELRDGVLHAGTGHISFNAIPSWCLECFPAPAAIPGTQYLRQFMLLLTADHEFERVSENPLDTIADFIEQFEALAALDHQLSAMENVFADLLYAYRTLQLFSSPYTTMLDEFLRDKFTLSDLVDHLDPTDTRDQVVVVERSYALSGWEKVLTVLADNYPAVRVSTKLKVQLDTRGWVFKSLKGSHTPDTLDSVVTLYDYYGHFNELEDALAVVSDI